MSVREKLSNLMVMPEPDKKLISGKLTDMLAFLGPGIIVASCTIGNGEIYMASRGGVIFGYIFIWTFLIGCIMKGLVVFSGTRYIAITGEHPFSRWEKIIPGPKNWLALLLGAMALISFPSWASSYMITLGQWTSWTFGLPPEYGKIYGTIWALLGFATFFIAAYSKVEKFQTGVVVLMIIFVLVAMFLARPDWVEVLKGFIPRVPADYAGWIKEGYPKIAEKPISLEVVAYLGAMGGGTYDYIGYVGMYREKKWGILSSPNLAEIETKLAALDDGELLPIPTDEENVKRTKTWMKAIRMDTSFSFFAVFLFSVAFMVLGAVVLGEGGLQKVPTDSQITQYQAEFFDSISEFMVYFYQLAVWSAFFGSMQALPTTVYPHTIRESFAPSFPALRKEENWNKLRFVVTAFFFITGLLLLWTGVSYTVLISFASVLGGVLSIGIWGIAQVYTEKKTLPKEYRMGKFLTFSVLISGIVLLVFGAIALVQWVQTLF